MNGRSQGIKVLDVLKIRQHIAHKIGYGYALALGTAILGTSVGMILGSHYSRQAHIKTSFYTEKKQLLNELNSQILSIQMHPLRLLAVVEESSIWLQDETNQFNSDITHLNRLLDEIGQFSQKHSNTRFHQPHKKLEQQSEQSPEQRPGQALTTLGSHYREALITYNEFITQTLWQTLNDPPNNRRANDLISEVLGGTSASQISFQFEQLSEDLVRLRQQTHQELQTAELQSQQAERLRINLIIISSLLSIGLGIGLALITSRAIARPIEQVTSIAQQVSESADFDLRVPSQTQDEVALLAEAFNQLISWAGEYTLEIQQARDTLEQRVQERTQALQQSEKTLQQKAADLEKTLIDLKQAQLQLIQSEKMSSLGQMVSGIAHEINNPITFIHGNLNHVNRFTEDLFCLLDLYQDQYPNPTEDFQSELEDFDIEFIQQDLPKTIQSMRVGTERVKEIVLSLRTFSRLDEAEFKATNIHEGIDSTLSILRSRLQGNDQQSEICVTKHYGDLPPVECHASQLNQVFMHLLTNAIEALNHQYQSATSTDNASTDNASTDNALSTSQAPPSITILTKVTDKEQIFIQITDNGPGISDRIKNRIFDPFFTTKAVGQGTGMGLPMSYQIITQQHQGQLFCHSPLSGGTAFTIQIPIQLQSAKPNTLKKPNKTAHPTEKKRMSASNQS